MMRGEKYWKVLYSIIFMTTAITLVSAAPIVYDFRPEQEIRAWTSWTNGTPVTINRVDLGHKQYALKLETVKSGPTTPILTLQPPWKVTAGTMLEFRILGDVGGHFEINLNNKLDGSEFVVAFTCPQNQWTTVRKQLAGACYKRFGTKDHASGFVGAELGRIQIAYFGKSVMLTDVKIYNSQSPLKELPDETAICKEYLQQRKKHVHPQLERNGVFPFGVISTVAAGDDANGKLLGQRCSERFENDLLDLKRHSMNVIANFCDSRQGIPDRLRLMDKYRLYLMETATAITNFTTPSSQPVRDEMQRCVKHPRLLAWYGADEPSDYQKYLRNKAEIEKIDPSRPVASAFCSQSTVQILGPCMDVVMIDPYSITPELKHSLPELLNHGSLVKNAKKLCGGKRLWLIAQAFSMRSAGNPTLRMPTSSEAVFDVYNALATGAGGFLFFIYNDTVPWLDGKVRREEFDRTMVDAWGNADPAYVALSQVGRTITPIMPSLLNAVPDTEIKLDGELDKLVVGQFKNQLGSYLFLVNRDLEKSYSGQVKITLPSQCAVYNLFSLEPDRANILKLNLEPGSGVIHMIATAKNFAVVRDEILSRRIQQMREAAEVEIQVLSEAKFDVSALNSESNAVAELLNHKNFAEAEKLLEKLASDLAVVRRSDPHYVQMDGQLKQVQQQFGIINRLLTEPSVMVRIDGKEAIHKFIDAVKTVSADYFRLQREQCHGNYSGATQLPALLNQVIRLRKQAEQIANNP